MKYKLRFFAGEAAWMEIPAPEQQAAIQHIGEWYGRHSRAGQIIGGHRLQGGGQARTVRLGRPGCSEEALVVDGAFLESKEVIGSYAVLSVPTAEDAIAIASERPGGGEIGIRPVNEE